MLKLRLSLAYLLLVALGTGVQAEDQEKAPPPPKPLTFQVPKGWKPIDPGDLVTARFQIGAGEQTATMTVTGLRGDGGGLAANINRWRSQVGLEPVPEKDAVRALQPVKVDGNSGHVLDLTGPEVAGKPTLRMRVGIVKHAEQTWYFRLIGPARLVGEQQTAFDGFLKSVRFSK